MIKVGIIGFGVMGKNHLNSLNKTDDVLVVGICDLDLHEYIFNGKNIALSLDALVEMQPDYCVVSVPIKKSSVITLRLPPPAVVKKKLELPPADTISIPTPGYWSTPT